MIRVLMVHCEFMPQTSGVARHMAGLASALVLRGDVIPTILAQRTGADGSFGCQVIKGGYRALLRQIDQCDIVHAHGARTAISAVALRLARMLGKPSVFTPHCYYQGGGVLRRSAKRVWDVFVESGSVARGEAVILLHEQWRQVVAEMGLHPRRVEVIPNCIDMEDVLSRLGQAVPKRLSGHPALLSVGRIDRIKRLDDAIQVLSEPGLERAELHLVGQGGDTARLQAMALALGVEGRVHFHGWCDDRKAAEMMQGCDTMLLASEREGMPTVLLEALLGGIPIVVSDIEGNRAVADAVGWRQIFPLGDCRAMAACIRECAALAVDRHVSERVGALFSWQSRAEEVAALYHDAVDGYRR
jgi:glycosyltransferase involved in cell wall biosynthesis